MSTPEEEISVLRTEIDSVDKGIAILISQRHKIALGIEKCKGELDLPIVNDKAESVRIDRFVEQAVQRGVDDNFARDLIRAIIRESRRLQAEQRRLTRQNETGA